MASNDPEDISSARERKRKVPEDGPYVLRSLIEDLPLSADGDGTDIEINCVEFLGNFFLSLTSTCLLLLLMYICRSEPVYWDIGL